MLAYITFGAFTIVGLFMMFIILLQRGRGGGLAGAFGGAGGQSAFGTRAGDVFTKITIIVAVLWVALAGASIFAFRAGSSGRLDGAGIIDDQETNLQVAPGENEKKDETFTPETPRINITPPGDTENEKKTEKKPADTATPKTNETKSKATPEKPKDPPNKTE